jgi:nucleotide-binding universal stress UspA family protein
VRQLVVASDLALHPDVALERGCEIAAATCADLHVLRLRTHRRRNGQPSPPGAAIEDLNRRFPCIGAVSFEGPLPCRAAAILERASVLDAELIVMRNVIDPDQSNDRPFDLILDVARQGSIPVLAAQREPVTPYRRVLALLDDREDSRQVLDLALQIRSATEILAVHACPPHATPQRSALALKALNQVIAATLAGRPDVAIPVRPIVRSGDLASVLIASWSTLHPDLIVAATHRRHGLEGIFRRSHVADLLEIMPFDLLVTNPETHERGVRAKPAPLDRGAARGTQDRATGP